MAATEISSGLNDSHVYSYVSYVDITVWLALCYTTKLVLSQYY